MWNIRGFYRLREQADFHKPGMHGSGRLWANACEVFGRVPSRGVRVAGLMLISWCVSGAEEFRVFHDFTFSNL